MRCAPRLSTSAMSRRSFLGRLGSVGGAVAAQAFPGRVTAAAAPPPRPSGTRSSLGVASGDPTADGFVIWTRLAPEPLAEGGGMPPRARHGRLGGRARRAVPARRARGHGDGPARAGARGARRAARARSRPLVLVPLPGGRRDEPGRPDPHGAAAGAPLARLPLRLRLVPALGAGYYTAYRHMLADDLDLVVHLGDYIYETPSWADEVRRHEGPEPTTLEEYRNRHALYKPDPDLQAAHAACPWAVTWDDHEVDNDYAADQSQDRDDPAGVPARARAAAYQAYWEHMPLRRDALPRGAGHAPLPAAHLRRPRGDERARHPPVPLRPAVRRGPARRRGRRLERARPASTRRRR